MSYVALFSKYHVSHHVSQVEWAPPTHCFSRQLDIYMTSCNRDNVHYPKLLPINELQLPALPADAT